MSEKIKRFVAAWHLRRARAIWRERRANRARVREYQAEIERAQSFARRVVAGVISDLKTR